MNSNLFLSWIILRYLMVGSSLTLFIQDPTFGQEMECASASIKYTLASLEVCAFRPIIFIGGSSALRIDVDSLSLPVAPTTEEVLRQMPLLMVRKNSRGEAEIGVRGSGSRQIAVLVDNVPITLSWDGRADVSIIPATSLQEAILVRGLSTMLYGPNVLGGIVDTRVEPISEPTPARSAQFNLGIDQVGAISSSAVTDLPIAAGHGQWEIRGGMGFWKTPGDPLPSMLSDRPPAENGLRLNTDSRNADGFMALRYQGNSGNWVSLSGLAFRAERGIAAQLGIPDEEARFWRYPNLSRTLVVASAGTKDQPSPFGGQSDLQVSLGFDQGRTDIEEYSSSEYDALEAFENGKDRTLTFRAIAGQTLGNRSDLQSAITVVDLRHEEIIPDGNFIYRQRLWSVGLESVRRLLDFGENANQLALSVGGAYDLCQTPEAGGKEPLDNLLEWGARLGLSAIMSNGQTILHTNISRRGRFPALRELYSGALNKFAPNPGLKPEHLVAIEAGIAQRWWQGEFQAVAFHNRLNDAVVRIKLDDGRYQRVNRNLLVSTGVELLGVYEYNSLEISGHAVLQEVNLTDTEAGQSQKPENMPELFGGGIVHSPLVLKIVGTAGVDYIGRQFAIDPVTGTDAQLDEALILYGNLSRRWPLRGFIGAGIITQLEIRLTADNITDAVYYDQIGLPEPGRLFRLELRVF